MVDSGGYQFCQAAEAWVPAPPPPPPPPLWFLGNNSWSQKKNEWVIET